jgi:FKBP-type peptidyl-prolyl cis-trans isomerase 2
MRTVQPGDQVLVHFVKRCDRGVVTSRGRGPLELTAGAAHRRLPGLGLALVGLAEGQQVVVHVPAGEAHGPPGRLRRLARSRFDAGQELASDSWVRLVDRRGRRRLVRVVEVVDGAVVVDTAHPWAGEPLTLEVEVVTIRGAQASSTSEPADWAGG